MLIDGFIDVPEMQDKWVFFAFSADYKSNIASVFMKVFNDNPQNTFQK